MLYGTSCCGVRDISGISSFPDPEESMKRILFEFIPNGRPSCGLMIFTYNEDYEYGQDFVEYIKENKLGKVTLSEPFENPNTNNPIVLGTWLPNEANCIKLLSTFKSGEWDFNGLKVGDKIKCSQQYLTSRHYETYYKKFDGSTVVKFDQDYAYLKVKNGTVSSLHKAHTVYFDVTK